MLTLFRKIGHWIDDQTGIVSVVSGFMSGPLPPGIGWAHVLGLSAAFFFLVQLITGAFMMIYYVPTPAHAYETIEYMRQLPFGKVVHGLHYYGATAMLLLVGLHLLRVFLWGAYKPPRQMIWAIGLVLSALTFAFLLTGYLLPWDQKAYWFTVAGTDIAGSIPKVGGVIQAALRGGQRVGAATLTRFFTIHVFLLPVLIELGIVFHILQVCRRQVTYPWVVGEAEDLPRPQRFFPEQFVRVALFALAVLVLLLLLATRGAPLEPMATPADATYAPRPQWYLLPVYQLLKVLPGLFGDFLGAIVIPSLLFVALLLLPYLDRNPERLPRRRPVALVSMVLVLGAVSAFGIQGLRSIPPRTKLSVAAQAGEKLYLDRRCHSCHPINGVGGNVAPDLAHVAKRKDDVLEKLLRQPSAFRERSVMPAVNLPPAEMKALVAFLQTVDEHYELNRTPVVGPKKPYSHYEENWYLAHQFEMRKGPTYCESCHEPEFCRTCHQQRRPESHLTNWLRNHYGVATASPHYCDACHEDSFCESCHQDTRHDETWTRRHGAVANERRELCDQCHRDTTCQTCHTGARPGSHGSGWLEGHGKSSVKGCDTCHQQSFCRTCHMGAKPRTHTPDWPRTHGRTAKRSKRTCTQCHSTSFCNSCHQATMPHPRSFKGTKHGAAAKRRVETCYRCHRQTYCSNCHGLDMPHPKGFGTKPHSDLAAKSPAACANCHGPKDCAKCHDADNSPESHWEDDYGKTHDDQSKGKEALCALCHGTTGCDDCHKEQEVAVGRTTNE